MIAIYLKEIRSFFNSLVAYIVIGSFLTGVGMYTWWFGENIFKVSEAQLDVLFRGTPYFFMFLIPAITMRAFAEETKTGTMELLLTKPLGDWKIIFGKYFAAVTLVVLCLLPTLVYYYSVYQLGDPVGNIDSAVVFGSYMGLILYGMVYTAVGIFSTSLTNNQIVAFGVAVLISVFLSEGLYHIGLLSGSNFIYELGLVYNYESISVGVLDSRNIVYFLSVSGVFLLGTKMVLASRKW